MNGVLKEFKCINCGETRQSEESCICSNCGYRMYEMPYDRRKVLSDVIKSFIKASDIRKIREGDLIFVGKDKDDKRFPDFNKIQNYVCSAEKTEIFIQRLTQSLEQIKKHIQSKT